MTNAASDVSANKPSCWVGEQRLVKISFLPFPLSVTCLFVPSILFHFHSPCDFLFSPHIWARHLSVPPHFFFFFFAHICSISPFFPLRRLIQSLRRVRKQTQIILGALLACDRGLASRFKWEHMEIITTDWHKQELVCPPGKKESAQIAGLHSSNHCNNHSSNLKPHVSG